MAKVVVERALGGDMLAVREIADRLDGKTMQAVESHNTQEHRFAVVPDKLEKDEWMKTYAPQPGTPKARKIGLIRRISA